MAFYEVEPFLQVDENQVSDTVAFIKLELYFMEGHILMQPRTSGASDSEDAEVGGGTVLGGVRYHLPIPLNLAICSLVSRRTPWQWRQKAWQELLLGRTSRLPPGCLVSR